MRIKIQNKILNDNSYSSTIKSISALHVVKLHSLFTKKDHKIKSLSVKFLRKIIFIIFNFHNLFKIDTKIKRQIPKRELLIISHFINHGQINHKEDFYFGNLENILNKMKISHFKLMINHTKYSSSYLNSRIKKKNLIILDKNLNIKIETEIFLKKIISIFELLLVLVVKKINIKEFFTLILSLFDSSTTFSMRVHYQIKDYVRKIRPNYFILTYEGYPWERMCINSVKKVNEKTKCIGYQHTPVTQNHRAIFNHISGNFNPDKIWCSEIKSFQILKKKIHAKMKKSVYFIGNFKKIVGEKFKPPKSKNSFLVIPEGIYTECESLFKFSLILARRFQEYNFIWRVHPVIDFNKVLKNLKLNKTELPKNITISLKKFEEDIFRSKYVIYKGSAAAIKSVVMGNYPIYFNSFNEKNFDPIIQIFKRRNYVSNEKNFLVFLKKTRNKNYKNEFKKSIFSLKNIYFSKPDLRKIKSHLLN